MEWNAVQGQILRAVSEADAADARDALRLVKELILAAMPVLSAKHRLVAALVLALLTLFGRQIVEAIDATDMRTAQADV